MKIGIIDADLIGKKKTQIPQFGMYEVKWISQEKRQYSYIVIII